MAQKSRVKVFVVAGLLAGLVSALFGYAWMYVAAAFLGYDNSMLKLSEATPHEVAAQSAGIAGFYGVVFGAFLVLVKHSWASSLFALMPFTWVFFHLLLMGRFRDIAINFTLVIAMGLISRLAANFSVARFSEQET